MNEHPLLPMWIVAQDGSAVELASVESLSLGYGGTSLHANLRHGGNTLLCRCKDFNEGTEVLRRLIQLLPIAVVDMDLDIIAPMERQTETEGTP